MVVGLVILIAGAEGEVGLVCERSVSRGKLLRNRGYPYRLELHCLGS